MICEERCEFHDIEMNHYCIACKEEGEERSNMKGLEGNKTYIVAAFAALATLLKYLGYIDDELYQAILGFLGAGGLATLAAKGNRIEEKVEDKR